MVFLNPAVLFGLLAASIPVIIHLLNLRKLKRIEFSTLSFLKELQKTKIKRVRIKQWILLALRIALILFLVAAFARPTIESVSLGGSASAAKTTAVFVLDNSFSMSVVDENGSSFNQAKEVMKTLLDEFQEGDEISIITTSNEQQIKPTTNFTQVRSFIENASVSNISRSLNNAVVEAADIVYNSQNFNKEIYIFSDLQKTTIYDSKSSLSDLGLLLNDQVKLYLFNFGDEKINNVSIADFELNNQIFERNKPISFSATFANHSSIPVTNSIASLFINGSRNAQQSISLKPGESKQVNFETTLKDAGLIEVMTELEDDAILQDNRRYLSFLVPEKINVLLLTDNPADSRFVELALGNSGNNSSIEIAKRGLNQISSLNLLDFNAIIIVGVNGINNYTRLKEYLEDGGGLIYMPAANTSIAKVQELSTELNIPKPSAFRGEKNKIENSIKFDKVDFQHPIFLNLFDTNDSPEIESPEIYYYMDVRAGSRGKNIISLLDNTSFLSEHQYGSGKILFFNTPPMLNSSDFPVKAAFAPLVNKSVFYLTNNVEGSKKTLAGSTVLINLKGSRLPQIKIVKPGGKEEFVNTDTLRSRNYLSYIKTEELGTYKFYSGDQLIDFVSVNPDEKESIIDYDDEAFENYLEEINFKGTLMRLSSKENFTAKIYQARFGSELWRYFILIALILALIEMTVARNAKKELTEINQK